MIEKNVKIWVKHATPSCEFSLYINTKIKL